MCSFLEKFVVKNISTMKEKEQYHNKIKPLQTITTISKMSSISTNDCSHFMTRISLIREEVKNF